MKVSYYPGCSLEGTAVDYAASIAGVTPLLDMELEEIEDWNCCGATAAHSINHKLSLALPARNLALAEAAGHDVVAPCALCFNRLKMAEKALQSPEGAELERLLWRFHQDLGPSGLPYPARLFKDPGRKGGKTFERP